MSTEFGTVWFVGAGPGDPELITVKGRGLVERAGAILFAGSLVSAAATRWAPADCVVADSKEMTLEQMSAWLIHQAGRCQTVVRLQTGDPGLYGALIELVQPLDAAGVPLQVVPGVSSAMASAAAAVESLTLPEVTQTVIFTRVEGRTPMPAGESLAALAAHHCTLCIFLSITLLGRVASELLAAGWSPDAPVVVVPLILNAAGDRKGGGTGESVQPVGRRTSNATQSMNIASPPLGARQWTTLAKSKLYDASFTHWFRRASVPVENLTLESP